MKVSCSARKDFIFPMRDHLDFMISHAKRHGNINFSYKDIDYVFGFMEGFSPLYGGRGANVPNISKADEYFLYDNNIGIKIPLSNKIFTEQTYQASVSVLTQYHNENNAVIVSNSELAEKIKNDFPKYKIEASAIIDILSEEEFAKCRNDSLYDTYVLPMAANDKIEWLNSIDIKNKIRLFWNVECSYTCPKKVCYSVISKMNLGKTKNPNFTCSKTDLHMPRTFYNDSIKWNEFYFDVEKFQKMGFEKFKMIIPTEAQQRTFILYENIPVDIPIPQ